jgi:hypothetical protein
MTCCPLFILRRWLVWASTFMWRLVGLAMVLGVLAPGGAVVAAGAANNTVVRRTLLTGSPPRPSPPRHSLCRSLQAHLRLQGLELCSPFPRQREAFASHR